jgi:hypothetical protein
MWNHDSLRKSWEERLPDDLDARKALIDLLVVVSPFSSVFGGIDNAGRGNWFQSMLFPERIDGHDNEHAIFYQDQMCDPKFGYHFKDIPPHRAHEECGELVQSESLNGRGDLPVDDAYMLLESYCEMAGGVAYNGSIKARDVRELMKVLGKLRMRD